MMIYRIDAATSILEMITALPELAASLSATVKDAEQPFIRLGGELQVVCGNVAELMQKTLDAITLIGAQTDGGILTRLDTLINDSLAALNSCHCGTEADLGKFKAVAGHLERLYRVCETAELIAKHLKIIGVNILIKSSKSQEFFEMFSFIARECKAFSLQVIDIAGKVREDASHTLFAQEAFDDRICNSLAGLRGLTEDARQVVRNAFTEIERLINFSSRILEQANAQTRVISDQVGEIVVGVQLYDNVNQRIEHIVTALNDTKELNDQGTKDSRNGAGEAERAASAYHCLGVQVGQLQQVISEIDAMHEKSQMAFAAIGTVITQLTESLATIGQSGDDYRPRNLEKENDPFATLNSALTHLQTLLARGDGLVGQIREATLHASEKVAKFTDHVSKIRKISRDMQLIAINAIINASHLGDRGSAFTVLAGELKGLSNKANIFVGEAEEIIEAIINSGQGQPASSPENLRQPGIDIASLEAAIKDVAGTYGSFRDNSASVFARAGTLRQTLFTISGELDFLPALAKDLRAHLEQLTAIHQQIGNRLDPDTLNSAQVLDSLAARYTMQQEREIHAQRMSGASLADAWQTEEQDKDIGAVAFHDAGPAAENDFGDNVELF